MNVWMLPFFSSLPFMFLKWRNLSYIVLMVDITTKCMRTLFFFPVTVTTIAATQLPKNSCEFVYFRWAALRMAESNARKSAGHGCRNQHMSSKISRSSSSSRSGGCRSVIQCATCSKTFNNSSALAKHKLIHSEERRYICNQCSKSFKRQDHL